MTEFPLFTRADEDKEFLAHGRWSSSHHPFTAPMWEDIGKMYDGQIAEVRFFFFAFLGCLSGVWSDFWVCFRAMCYVLHCVTMHSCIRG